MKKYNVTVNGVVYEVVVEEADGTAVSAPAAAPAPVASPAPVAAPAPKATPAPAAAAPKASGAQGSIKVVAPMPGTILKLNVKVGDTLKANDLVCILEAMKMENEIMSPRDGVVAGVHVSKGESVDSGKLLVSLQ